jgi:hypothetical protein
MDLMDQMDLMDGMRGRRCLAWGVGGQAQRVVSRVLYLSRVTPAQVKVIRLGHVLPHASSEYPET